MKTRAMGIAWAMSASLLGGCQETTSPNESVEIAEVKNGFVWDPWAETTQTWTRNVVRVGGCTGTLLDYEWVLSAAHCFDEGQDPATITVRHRQANGVDDTAIGEELLFHPDRMDGIDVALIRLATPLRPGVATLPIAGGTTAGLIGDSVFCAGYGAIDTGGACETGADCASDEFCKWGVCMERNDGPLRTGTFTVIEDREDTTKWYELDVPNADGQMLLPGDSGSSCWNGQALTGINKGGNATNRNRQTSGPTARAWIEAVVTPPILKETNAPAASCRGVDGAVVDYHTTGNAMNATGSAIELACPITRPVTPAFADYISVPRLWVYDRHPTEDVCCSVHSKNAGGALVTSEPICSTGNSTTYQTLVLPSVHDSYSFSHASVVCTVPPASTSGTSGLHGLRARQANR